MGFVNIWSKVPWSSRSTNKPNYILKSIINKDNLKRDGKLIAQSESLESVSDLKKYHGKL